MRNLWDFVVPSLELTGFFFICPLAFVFTKATSKTLDLAAINYIINSPAARSLYASTEPVKELNRQQKPKVYVSYNVGSSDRKTYYQSASKIQKEAQKVVPPPPPERPAHVILDSVSAFYQEFQAPPASHNAVVQTMTPAMRQRLKARRIRGGEVSNILMERLTVGSYFAAWYALNVIYNSKCLRGKPRM
jgi:hypothetical protein